MSQTELEAAQILEEAMAGKKFKWTDLLLSMMTLRGGQDNLSPPSEKAKEIMLKIMNYNGKIDIIWTGDGPHSKSPEDMLKFIASQILNKWGIHHPDIEKIFNDF